jgi:hypothetical protein
VAGSFTQLGTYANTDETVHVQLELEDIKAGYLNTIERISSSDDALTSDGFPGFWLGGHDDNRPTYLDNFVATDLVPPSQLLGCV